MTAECIETYSISTASIVLSEANSELKKIASNSLKLAAGKLDFFLERSATSGTWLDSFRLLQESFSNDSHRVLRNFLLEGFCSVEKAHPGGGYFYLLAVCQGLLYDYENPENLKELSKFTYRANKKELLECLNFKQDAFFENTINFIINQSGFTSTFSIEEIKSFESKFICSSSYTFPILLPPEFANSIKKDKLECFDSKVVVIDGVIETIGEIHHLLNHFNETKQDLLLIARGFDPDVLNTLIANYVRKTLRVIPGKLNLSLESINTLKDVSISCGTPLISSFTGETISSIEFNQLKNIHYYEISKKECKIRNPKTKYAVAKLIRQIDRKISNCNIEDKRAVLRKRSEMLKGRKSTIRLGTHLEDSRGIVKDRILNIVGIVNTASRYGILNLRDIEELPLNNLKHIVKSLRKLGFNKIPAASFIHGVQIGFLTAANVKNGGCVLLLDDA